MLISRLYRERYKNSELRKRIWMILTTEFFQRFVDRNDVVLDMPCGYGEFINAVACRTKYAVDTNIDAKQHLGDDVFFLQESSTKLSLGDASIDKIFISNFFEHLTHDDIVATLDECRRILKLGGRVLVLQPNVRFAAKNYWMFFDHITPIDDRALEEVFVATGFTLRKRILKFVPLTTKSRFPTYDLFVRLYIRLPFLWRIFGKQSFLVFEK